MADKETFETDHFLLAYLDAKGRVIMQGRILVDGDRLTQVSTELFQAIPPMEVFEEGTLGPDYVVAAGNAGDREVFYWNREDLEDDLPLGDEAEDPDGIRSNVPRRRAQEEQPMRFDFIYMSKHP